jgi:hypothetical protein
MISIWFHLKNKLDLLQQFTSIPILLESGKGYRIVWELIGSYEVSGYIDGKQISYTTKGYLEYVA